MLLKTIVVGFCLVLLMSVLGCSSARTNVNGASPQVATAIDFEDLLTHINVAAPLPDLSRAPSSDSVVVTSDIFNKLLVDTVRIDVGSVTHEEGRPFGEMIVHHEGARYYLFTTYYTQCKLVMLRFRKTSAVLLVGDGAYDAWIQEWVKSSSLKRD